MATLHSCHLQMATPKCVEAVTLQQCVHKLAKGMSADLTFFANKLFEKRLIPQRSVREALNPTKDKYDKATELVMQVINIVENSPDKFEVFMNVLGELSCLDDLVKLLNNLYEFEVNQEKERKAKVELQNNIHIIIIHQHLYGLIHVTCL